MRDGSGDDFFALFNPAGCWLKGFAPKPRCPPYNKIPVSLWPGIINSVWSEFAECLKEPAFKIEDTTFCIWRKHSDALWQRGDIMFPEGHADLTAPKSCCRPSMANRKPIVIGRRAVPSADISLRAVKHVYEHRPLNAAVIADLNPEITLDDLEADLEEIKYPVS